MCLWGHLFQSAGIQVDKFCSKTTLRQWKQRIKYHLDLHTFHPGQKSHKWQAFYRSQLYAAKWKLPIWTKLCSASMTSLAMVDYPGGVSVAGERWRFGCFREHFGRRAGGWSKWKTNASSAHSAIFPVKIKGVPDWPLHGKLEMGPAFVCCC